MLKLRDLSAWYGEAQALHGVNLSIERGEVVTLVGRNGAGKTTTLRCVMGLHRQMSGRVFLGDVDITNQPPHLRARAGLGYVPDDRGTYATLTVEENLLLPPAVGPDAWSLDRIYAMFPRLKERRRHAGSKLSGGERQMLAIARVLRMGSRLLLLDEPTEGLAPIFVQQLGMVLREVKAQGVPMLLIEQNLRFATSVADRHYLLAQGAIVEVVANEHVKQREHELLAYLGM
jgi:branched-chain amino acid transport system ATP-binding protein